MGKHFPCKHGVLSIGILSDRIKYNKNQCTLGKGIYLGWLLLNPQTAQKAFKRKDSFLCC